MVRGPSKSAGFTQFRRSCYFGGTIWRTGGAGKLPILGQTQNTLTIWRTGGDALTLVLTVLIEIYQTWVSPTIRIRESED